MRILVVLAVVILSCAVADEDEISVLEREIRELERVIEDHEDCEKALAQAVYRAMECEKLLEECGI